MIMEVDEEDGVIIEKKIVPPRRDRTGPAAFLLVAVFIVTYAMVMFSDRLGIGPKSVTAAGNSPPPVETAN
jgi:hypothetical protein